MYPHCLNGWGNNMTLDWSPLLSPVLLALLAVALIVPPLLGLFLKMQGALLRVLGGLIFLLALLQPSFVDEKRTPLKTIVPVLVDRSGSQQIGTRQDDSTRALEEVKAKLGRLDFVEARIAEINESGEDGTRLFDALQKLTADVPPEQLGGAILITDGEVHDIPKSKAELQFPAPVHALITGYEKEPDRRVRFIDPPRFGLVGKEQSLTFEVTDSIEKTPVPLIIKRDGIEIARLAATPGVSLTVQIGIEHGGPNVIEAEIAPRADELTLINNRVVTSIDGIRDKLRVLLVSGEPHPGERTWRNMLKSDPNVDLVHFTILRPPQKLDATPINELSLIAFPTRELFEVKIKEFDLIILDRYSDLVMMPPAYFRNMVNYVREGGAMLVAAGPEFSGEDSLAETSLQAILPALPDGMIYDLPFKPKLTQDGAKHPVTRDLQGADLAKPQWGEWIRQISATPKGGSIVMNGVENKPLLILNHEGKGRVALLLSDHAWLWARDFHGGGPHLDMLRRTGHWLMKEPDLEEEALRAFTDGKSLIIERQSMSDKVEPVRVTSPTGKEQMVTVQNAKPGLWRGTMPISETGLYALKSGPLTSFAAVGEPNPREFRDVLSTRERLQPVADMTGGGVLRLKRDKNDTVRVPNIIRLSEGKRYAGADYIGIRNMQAATIDGVKLFPVFTGALGLLLMAFGILASWLGERGLSRRA